MKKLLVAAGMLMVMSGAAAAQGGGGGGMGMGGGRMQMSPEAMDSTQLSRLFEGITLNADQTAKAKGILKAAREGMAGMDRQAPDFREKMMESNNKRNADLKALLSSDADKAKFDENAARGRGGRRGGGL
jgi:Spy/CpxP family protein refolding chaperone